MAKKIKKKPVSRADYRGFLDKAQEYFESMHLSFAHSQPSPAASAGIHCAILAGDACLIYAHGYKCSSERHLDLVPLIEQSGLRDAKKAATHLSRILDVKSFVEYTGDHYTLDEAKQILTRVERFYRWVSTVLP